MGRGHTVNKVKPFQLRTSRVSRGAHNGYHESSHSLPRRLFGLRSNPSDHHRGFSGPAPPPKSPLRGTFRPESCVRLLRQTPTLRWIVLDVPIVPLFVRALEPIDGQAPCSGLQEYIVFQLDGHEMSHCNSIFALSSQRKDHGCPCVRYRIIQLVLVGYRPVERIIQLLFVTRCNRNLYHEYSSQPSHADAVINVLKFQMTSYSICPSNKFTPSQMRVAGSLLNEKKERYTD